MDKFKITTGMIIAVILFILGVAALGGVAGLW